MKRLHVGFVCALAFVACKKETPAQAPAEKPAAEKAAEKAPAADPTAAAAPGKKESEDACVGPFATGTKSTLQVGAQTYERNGYVLTRTSSDPDDQVVFGVLSDVKEDSPENMKNIEAALEFFKTNKAEIILFLGDSAETQQGVTNVLGALGKSGLPVFAIIGNRECKQHWVAGMAEAQKAHANIFDFTQIRVFNSDDVSVLSLPGYYNPTYLHCTEGCRYFPSDVENLKRLVGEATATPLLISHGPPRQDGAQGLDRIHDDANVGDPALAEFLQKNPIPFGAFANIGEAGGKATDASGKNVVAQDTFANTLYLNTGFTDSIQWQMHDGTTSQGMASLLTIKGKQAAYKIKRFGPAQTTATK